MELYSLILSRACFEICHESKSKIDMSTFDFVVSDFGKSGDFPVISIVIYRFYGLSLL